MARLRGAPTTQNILGTTQTTRQALKEKTNTVRQKPGIHESDEITDSLVKDARPKRGRAKKAAQNVDEFVMAGALGHGEPQKQTVLPSEHPTTTDELAKSDGPPPPNAKPNRRPPRMTRKAVQTEAKSEVLQNVKKRMMAAENDKATTKPPAPTQPSQERGKASSALPAKTSSARKSGTSNAERSEFSLSPSPPPPGKLSAVKDKRSSLAQQDSAVKAQGTPGLETSILALKNFKRRPRQPSMLQMVQQLTASARPSAVHVQANEDPSVFDLEGDGPDEEEFAPDAEGTPLHVSKMKSSKSTGAKQQSNSKQMTSTAPITLGGAKKRKSEQAGLSSSALGASKTKRLKPNAAPRVISSTTRSSSNRQTTPQPQISSDAQAIASEPSSTPPTEPPSDAGLVEKDLGALERDRQLHHQQPPVGVENDQGEEILNGTMAEPASSSPLPSPRTLVVQNNVSAEPLTQRSPAGTREKTRKAAKSKPITTATLQALLPKRRQPLRPRQRVSEYDIEYETGEENIGMEEDDQHRARSRRQTKSVPTKGKKAAALKGSSRQSTAISSNRKSAAPPPRKSTARPATVRKSGKTYRHVAGTASDKENENDAAFESLDENDESALPDTSLSMYEAAQSKELEEARKKFAEVDDWDMEFESMSIEEGRSSSQNWR